MLCFCPLCRAYGTMAGAWCSLNPGSPSYGSAWWLVGELELGLPEAQPRPDEVWG